MQLPSRAGAVFIELFACSFSMLLGISRVGTKLANDSHQGGFLDVFSWGSIA
jgi:hypothetical protein